MIIDKISSQIVEDYKSGNEKRRVLYQTLKAALLNKQKELKDAYSENEEIKVLKNELKQRKEAMEQFEQASRNDLAEKNKEEIDLISQLLPEQMNEEQLEKIVKEKIQSLDDKSFGSIMKAVMAETKGNADGKVVSDLVRKNLP